MNSEERSPSTRKRYVCWNEMDLYIPCLRWQLDESEYKIEDYEAVVAIRRGGIVAGLALSHYYNKPLIIIDPFDFDPKDLPNPLLVIDDVIDTGCIYHEVRGKIQNHYPIFAFLFRKPWSPKNDPKLFAVIETSNFVVFPWEIEKDE